MTKRKMIYWHRVIHVEDWANNDMKVGTLIGLDGKETELAKIIEDTNDKGEFYIDFRMYCTV